METSTMSSTPWQQNNKFLIDNTEQLAALFSFNGVKDLSLSLPLNLPASRTHKTTLTLTQNPRHFPSPSLQHNNKRILPYLFLDCGNEAYVFVEVEEAAADDVGDVTDIAGPIRCEASADG